MSTVAQTMYCLKCKAAQAVKNVEEVVMKNGRPALKAICNVCGTKTFKIVSTKK